MNDPLLQFAASLGPKPGDTLESAAARIERAIDAMEAARIADQMTDEQLRRIIKAAGETA